MSRTKILFGVEAAESGVLKHIMFLVAKLDRRNFKITIALSDLRRDICAEIETLRNQGVTIVKIPMMRSVHPWYDMLAFFRIFMLIWKGDFDVVHAQSSKAGALFLFAAWLNRIPKIFYTPHCFYFQGQRGIKKKLFILIERIIGLFYTAVIVSDNEKRFVLQHRIVPPSKIQNINNAIDFNAYRQYTRVESVRSQWGIAPEDVVVGAVGRLAPQKDWFTFILAAQEVLREKSNVKFLIVGSGEQREVLEHTIEACGLQGKVILTGHVHEIHKVYAILDVFLNTSQWEGLPYVFLEAMYYKIPIVATDTGNDDTIVDGKTGYVTRIKDYHQIASRVRQLLSDVQVGKKMGYDGWLHLQEKYSFRMFIDLHQKLYKTAQRQPEQRYTTVTPQFAPALS